MHPRPVEREPRSRPPSSGVEVLLTISSMPQTVVVVIKASGEQVVLGEVPLDRMPGASVGDEVVMSNKNLGIYYREKIASGQANENRVIFKEFALGKLKVVPSPATKGLSVWRGEEQLASDLARPVPVYEGTQKLELRGETLRAPVVFEAVVKPEQTTTAKVDVSQALVK